MPVLNRASELQPEVAEWRRHLHENPELLFDVHGTAAFVADKLTEFGCDIVKKGIGRTGVVGLIKGSHQGTRPGRSRDRAARRHGCVAAHRNHRQALGIDDRGSDACLRP